MDLRTVTLLSGVLGGTCWVVRAVLDLTGADSPAASDGLYWAGLALLALTLAGFGAGLVSRSTRWLQAIVAVALPLLVWSVVEVLHPVGDPAVVDGVVGAGLGLLAGFRLTRGGGDDVEREPRRPHGAHSR